MEHWFEALADHLGSAYLRYSFTKNTTREVDFLVDALELKPGAKVLDVGCGPGRHANELASRGFLVVGVDISARFIEVAQSGASLGATYEVANARHLGFDSDFDAAYAMCQGAFGLQCGPAAGHDVGNLDGDRAVLQGMRDAVKAGGAVGVAAFSAYFQVRNLEGGTDGTFDAATATHHEHTKIKSPDGVVVPADLWTTCFTPRELVLLAQSVQLTPTRVWSMPLNERLGPTDPVLDEPQFFLTARRSL